MLVYQDDVILVCRKPSGLSSEAGGLPEQLKEATGAKEIYCVHRLDRETGGLMVYAKTKQAAAKLSAAIAAGRLGKSYLAVVEGDAPERGRMEDLLYHDARRNKSYVVTRQRRGVRDAALEFERLAGRNSLSLVRIKLLTGHTHQIRVQFASRALPLVGDRKYGSRNRALPLALWSAELSFPHPDSGETLCFTASPPALEPWISFPEAFPLSDASDSLSVKLDNSDRNE